MTPDNLTRRARGTLWSRLFLIVAARREPRTMDARKLMEEWDVGSGDWSWLDEITDIIEREGDQSFWRFVETIRAEGVREPVLLGDDGRVWDGHHRIIAALYAEVDVPVEYAGGRRWRLVEWVRGWRR